MTVGINLGLREALLKFRGVPCVKERLVEELVNEIENTLLVGNVHHDYVRRVCERIKERSIKDSLSVGEDRRNYTLKCVYEELKNLIGNSSVPFQIDLDQKSIFMFIGLNGSEKTTTLIRAANKFLKKRYEVSVIESDLTNKKQLNNLQASLSKLNVELYYDDQAESPLDIVRNGMNHFLSKEGPNIILLNTPKIDEKRAELLEELYEMVLVSQPTKILLVIDSNTGHQSSEIFTFFNQSVPVDSIILSKIGFSSKFWGAFSSIAMNQVPISFLSYGESLNNFVEFSPHHFIVSLLGFEHLEDYLLSDKDPPYESPPFPYIFVYPHSGAPPLSASIPHHKQKIDLNVEEDEINVKSNFHFQVLLQKVVSRYHTALSKFIKSLRKGTRSLKKFLISNRLMSERG